MPILPAPPIAVLLSTHFVSDLVLNKDRRLVTELDSSVYDVILLVNMKEVLMPDASVFGEPIWGNHVSLNDFSQYLPKQDSTCRCNEDIVWLGCGYMKMGDYILAFLRRGCGEFSENRFKHWLMEDSSSEYLLLHLLLRPKSVCSFILIPLITSIMANIAVSESLFLKNVLISDRNFVTLCIGIGVMSLFVSHLKVTHFLRHMQDSNAFFVSIYSHFH